MPSFSKVLKTASNGVRGGDRRVPLEFGINSACAITMYNVFRTRVRPVYGS